MAKRSLEAKLARLRQLRDEPASPQLAQELRSALADGSNLVVAAAAEAVGQAGLLDLAPDLVAAFDRFLVDPVRTDKLCSAKTALALALDRLEYPHAAVFLRGIRHVQPEPAWGGSRDTAAPLRATCAFALARIDARGVLPLLVDLLTDPEKVARVGAAQALAYCGSEAAGLLLRLKARVGDKDPEVVAECLRGVLQLSAQEGVSFVAGFLRSADEAIAESAVLALGDSRRPEAFDALKAFWTAARRRRCTRRCCWPWGCCACRRRPSSSWDSSGPTRSPPRVQRSRP
jgi:HEAT repeat protein